MTRDQGLAPPVALPNATAEQLHVEFWTGFLDRARRQGVPTAPEPSVKHYIAFSAGIGDPTHYSYVIREHDAQVALIIDGGNVAANKRTFDQLHAAKRAVEASFGEPLYWERLDQIRRCRIALDLPGGGLRDRERWPEIQDRLIEAMVRLEKALRPQIHRLPSR